MLLNRTPWAVSYDALMPFYPKPYLHQRLHNIVFEVLARDCCRAVLPHSMNALTQMIRRNASSPKLQDVLKWTTVVYPAVADYPELAASCGNRDLSAGVRCLFVGRQFFIKGGHIAAAVLEVLSRDYPVSFTVVSEMSTADWTTEREPAMATEWTNRLAAMGATHYAGLDNPSVRKLMAEHDVLLLPSIDETFGFVLLEAMATGMAVVATGIRAIPEIVPPGRCGVLLECDVDDEGRLKRDGNHEERIYEQLHAGLQRMLNDLPMLQRMKNESRSRYKETFTVARLSNELAEVYGAALQ